MLLKRETWAYGIAKFLVDPVWWMFLFWLPDFFSKRHGLNLRTFGISLAIVYIASDVGSVAGGYRSSRLMKAGLSLNASRKLTMCAFAILVMPIIFAASIDRLWLAVMVLSLATAAHQGFAANLFTLPSNLFPRKAVGTITGIGGAVGAIGGMLMAQYAGHVLQRIGTYTPIFAACGGVYVIAIIVIHVLSPRMTLEFLFAQVSLTEARVDTTPNRGNMLAAVVPFALETGLVKASGEVTTLRVLTRNTGTLNDIEVQNPGG